jgi:hypothetical protein
VIRYNKNQKILVFDTETEGLNLCFSRPWQVSFSIGTLDKTEEVHDLFIDVPDLWNWVPQQEALRVQAMTHFNWNDYNILKTSPQEVWRKFSHYLNNPDYLIVGQNILNYDVFMVAILQRMAGVPIDYAWLRRLWDTRALGRAWRDNYPKPQDDNFLAWQYRCVFERGDRKTSVSLKKMAPDLGVEYDPTKHHDALYDIDLTKRVFEALIKKLDL